MAHDWLRPRIRHGITALCPFRTRSTAGGGQIWSPVFVPKERAEMRRFLALAAKIAVSAALLYVAFARVDLGTIGARLQQANISWLVALELALAAQLVLAALRWRQIALQCSAQFTIPSAMRYVLIGWFFNQTLPSTIGGDAARVWLVSRAGAGWKPAAYSVVVDRIVGLAVLAVIVIVCMPWLLDLVRDPLGRVSVVLVNSAAIVATIVFLILGQVHWQWLDRWWIARHVAGTAAVAFKVVSTWRIASVVVGLSVAIHLLTIAAIWSAARSVAAPLEFWQALLLVPPVVLVSTVPVSIAGWGVREGAMMTVFSYAGLLDSDGLIISILYGAGLFAVGAVGGLVWILGSDQRIGTTGPSDREPEERH
jgi:glycosyltransferase 2 family protein